MTSLSGLFALGESELYQRLTPHVVRSDRLNRLGYPQEDISFRRSEGDLIGLRRRAPLGVTLHDGYKSAYRCKRCAILYMVDRNTGMQLAGSGSCRHHPGRVWQRELNNQYNCCRQSAGSAGCTTIAYHVHEQEPELCNYTGFVRTQSRGETGRKVFAIDCEMCFTTIGMELTQVTLLNFKKELVYQTFCKPINPILDYNTKYSGISAADLDKVDKTLADVQRDLLEFISAESILVGHGLDSDFTEIKIFHENVIDTVALYPHKRGLPFKNGLRLLVKDNLGKTIQDSSHDSNEDARAAFDLALYYVSRQNYLPAMIRY